MATFSSPNRVVSDYYGSLCDLERQAREASSAEASRQSAVLTIVMAVTVVEVFFNLWFRVLVEERGTPADRDDLERDIEKPGLYRKLKRWPRRYLGQAIDLDAGAGSQFIKLNACRNSIVHFKSSHQSIEFEQFGIHGLADTSAYDALGPESATWALNTTVSFVIEVMRASGLSDHSIGQALHLWTGQVNGT